MEMDLKPAVCDRKKLAVWFAFWGEVKTVPTYQKICAAYNDKYKEILRGLCETIISEGNYVGLNAKTVTNALSSLTDGLWLYCLINPKSFDRTAALQSRRIPRSLQVSRTAGMKPGLGGSSKSRQKPLGRVSIPAKTS
jgi:TetR/AcrR family transcriptional repressor of bet genes